MWQVHHCRIAARSSHRPTLLRTGCSPRLRSHPLLLLWSGLRKLCRGWWCRLCRALHCMCLRSRQRKRKEAAQKCLAAMHKPNLCHPFLLQDTICIVSAMQAPQAA